MVMDELQEGIMGGIGSISSFVGEHPVKTAIGVAGVTAVGAGVAGVAIAKAKRKAKKKTTRKTKRKTRKRRSKRVTKRKGKRKTKQKKPYTAGKGKDRSTRRIRFTKNNQPYVILASGKARFIKKSSVRRSRRLKGGRY